jgi:hypothetical protein
VVFACVATVAKPAPPQAATEAPASGITAAFAEKVTLLLRVMLDPGLSGPDEAIRALCGFGLIVASVLRHCIGAMPDRLHEVRTGGVSAALRVLRR